MNNKTRLPGIHYPTQLKCPVWRSVFATLRFTAHAVEFNVDMIDVEDRENIDISRFEKKGYIPSRYPRSCK